MVLAGKSFSFPLKEVIGVIVTAVLVGGWALKENVADHDKDVGKINSKVDTSRFERARGQDSVLFQIKALETLVKDDICQHHKRSC